MVTWPQERRASWAERLPSSYREIGRMPGREIQAAFYDAPATDSRLFTSPKGYEATISDLKVLFPQAKIVGAPTGTSFRGDPMRGPWLSVYKYPKSPRGPVYVQATSEAIRPNLVAQAAARLLPRDVLRRLGLI